MPIIDTAEIERLIAQNQFLCNSTKVDDPAGQTIVKVIQDGIQVIENDYKTNFQSSWTLKTDQEKEQLRNKIVSLQAVLQKVVADGPTQEDSNMFKAYASNTSIFLLSLWSVLGTGMALFFLSSLWPNDPALQPFDQTLSLIAVSGALGGYVNCIQSFGRYVGNRQLLRSWIIYYLLFPLKGASLATIVFLFSQWSRSGLVATEQAQSLNLQGYCALAALIGLFANQAIEMLSQLFSVIFKQVEGKDKLEEKGQLSLSNIFSTPANPNPKNKGSFFGTLLKGK